MIFAARRCNINRVAGCLFGLIRLPSACRAVAVSLVVSVVIRRTGINRLFPLGYSYFISCVIAPVIVNSGICCAFSRGISLCVPAVVPFFLAVVIAAFLSGIIPGPVLLVSFFLGIRLSRCIALIIYTLCAYFCLVVKKIVTNNPHKAHRDQCHKYGIANPHCARLSLWHQRFVSAVFGYSIFTVWASLCASYPPRNIQRSAFYSRGFSQFRARGAFMYIMVVRISPPKYNFIHSFAAFVQSANSPRRFALFRFGSPLYCKHQLHYKGGFNNVRYHSSAATAKTWPP